MTSIQFTEADRDERGFVKAPARSLADLLPEPSTAKPSTMKPITRQELLSAGGVALLFLLALLYISSGQPAAPAPVLSQATAMIAAAPVAHPTPAATPAPVAMRDAFAAPEGLRLGAIEATRAITPVAHFGADWIQADVAGSGRIWLRTRDWPLLAITGDNLEPRAVIAPDIASVDSATPELEEPRTGTKPADDRALAHALAVQQEREQHDSGRSNAAVQQQATDAAQEPSYIANVGQQAPHVPRGGLCGPASGDCAPVPTAAPDMLIVIGQQTPHKVR